MAKHKNACIGKQKLAKTKLTRKEQRKQKTQQKKEIKRLYFSKKLLASDVDKSHSLYSAKKSKNKPKFVREKPLVLAPESLNIEQRLSDNIAADDESIASDFSDEDIDTKIREAGVDLAKIETKNQKTKSLRKQQTRPDVEEQHRREIKRQKDLEQASRKQRKKQLRLQNEEEDVEIARLEKKLKLNRTKDKNRLVRKMFNDGLDYALELFLEDEEERAKLELKEKRKKAMENNMNSDDEDDKISFDTDDEIKKSNKMSKCFNEDNSDDGTDYGNTVSDEENSEKNVNTTIDEPSYTEDIYGRKRDKDGNIIDDSTIADVATMPQKYLPPQLRAKLTTQNGVVENDEKQTQLLERLRKQCKGLLNRLSETNLHKIAIGIEELYMRNSRYNMNETLTTLLNEALIARTMSKERMMQEHMVLLAYLHAHIGSEIGAHFLQFYIEKFNAFLKSDLYNLPIEDKRLNNVVLFLAYMYIFKIYEHRLLIEIIDKLAEKLCEKTIECMLLIFQSVGFKLRKDDPAAFKQMTNTVQQRIAAAPLEIKENLRLRFMVDTINAVKNNNINKIPQFDPQLAEDLRKRLKTMLRNDKYVTTLNITMEDLLRADQVGKWWVVGSAWSGNIKDIAAAQKQCGCGDDLSNGAQKFSERLLNLAKQQQMNTDERRNIFCIVMSAEDYVDAFEKILQLSLKDQRSIAYVIIHCGLNEAHPNPYYAHLALKFCNYNRKFLLAFQFASWDRINDIESLSKQQIKNFGQFLQHLIINGGIQLTVLKVIDFIQLQKSSFLLMREVVVGLLLHESEREVYQAFERIAKNPKVQQFKHSLQLFMQHFLLKQKNSKLKLHEEQLTLLTKRVDYVDKLLSYVDL